MSDGPTIGHTLALRAGEICQYSSEVPEEHDGPLYAVALLRQHFPHHGLAATHCRPYIVACASYVRVRDHDYKTWGWVHLDPDARAIIGTGLWEMYRSQQIEPGDWVYLTIGWEDK